MTVEKISVSLEKSLARRIRQLAKREKTSVSALTSRALEREEKLDSMRRAIEHYEAEFGVIADEDVERAGKILWPD